MFNAFYGVDIKPYYIFIFPCFFIIMVHFILSLKQVLKK